jgi:chorismate dehydratase
MHSDYQHSGPQKSRSLFTTGQLATIKNQTQFGSVPYLNARPLHWMLRESVSFLEPHLLSVELAAGRLHAALIPVYSILENADLYHVVDGYAIGSLNIVYSVVMSHVVPVVRLKTIALDPASRTSNNLVRILLEKYYRIKPQYVSPDEPADGQVMIGDPAIAYRQSHPDERYLDLSQSWHSHTGLPFVFAAWAVRKDAPDVKGIARQLRSAAVLGLNERHVIARSPFEYRYLTENLYYHMGNPQRRAIDAFAADLAELGLLARRPVLSYI